MIGSSCSPFQGVFFPLLSVFNATERKFIQKKSFIVKFEVPGRMRRRNAAICWT
jgi:hypothetical protein